MNKKKIIIIGMASIITLTSAIVIPIIVVNSNNDKKNKEDVVAVIKILKEKTVVERTLELVSDSNGKIIVDNKEEVIKKVKELIGTSKLREVSIDVSMITDTDISKIGQAIIITIKKGEYSQQLEGDNGLKVLRAKNIRETKIYAIQTYLNKIDNLNLILPKDTSSNYDVDAKVLAAIKVKLIAAISEINDVDFDNLITKKVNENNVTSIANHSEKATAYIITIDGQDFTLKLNQDEFTDVEKTKIAAIKTYLESSINLNLILPKDNSSNYDADAKVLAAIKVKLITAISEINDVDFDNLITKKVNENNVTSIANHGEKATTYIITIDEQDFTLKLNQDEFTDVEKTKIAAIKTYLESSINLNLILPKDTSSNYDADTKVLAAIKVKLITAISEINDVDFDNLITKKINENNVTSIANHGEKATTYIITIDEQDFTLKLNQDEFTDVEKTKIAAIKTYLESSINLNLILPKDTSSNYDADAKVLAAIKVKLITAISEINDVDFDNLIIKKVGERDINSVAANGQSATPYIITVGGVDFTLSLKQSDSFNTKQKIKFISEYLKNSLTLKLPQEQTSFTYNTDEKILNAIRNKLVKLIGGIEISDSNLIIKKIPSWILTSVNKYNGRRPTFYKITIGEEDFTLKLEQDEFTEQERNKIKIIKTYLENPNNLNFILPKDTNSNYDTNAKVLAAIKIKLIAAISEINNVDFNNLIDENNEEDEAIVVTTHNEKASNYIIIVDGQDFTLKLNQDEFTDVEKTKIAAIKTYLESSINLNLILPKDTSSNYDADAKVLAAIKVKLIAAISEINDVDFDNLIIKKVGERDVNSIAANGQSATPYIITVGGVDFTLSLKQSDSFNTKQKIKFISEYLKNSLTLKLPQEQTSFTYNTDEKILNAIRNKLVKLIDGIEISDSNLIIKKIPSWILTSIEKHNSRRPSFYKITIGEEDFTLKLEQDEFTEQERNKIKIIKTYLENPNNLNLILPKDTNSNYDTNAKVLAAIKIKLIAAISEINNVDFNNLIDENNEEDEVIVVATHNEEANNYIIIVDGQDFTLKLKQDEFTDVEKTKIVAIKTYLESSINLNLILPKDTSSNYDTDAKVLTAIKVKLITAISEINDVDFDNLIIKKVGEKDVNSVAANGRSATPYIITVGGSHFTLYLIQVS